MLYLNLFEWIVAFATLIGWARFSTFAAKDVSINLVDQPEMGWRMGFIGVLLGMLLIYLLMPNFWLALPVNLIIAGGMFAAYNMVRVKTLGAKGNLFKGTLDTFGGASETRSRLKASKQMRLTYLHKDDSAVDLPGPEDPLAAGLVEADEIMIEALARRAEQVELVPGQGSYALSYIVDGVSYNQPAKERTIAESALQAIKVLGGLAAEERRRPQTGRFKTRDAGQSVTVWSVQTSGTTAGERLTLVANEKGRWEFRLDALGFTSDQLKDVKSVTADTKGLVLVSSPKGNGRTSTLYALMREHDAFMNSVASLETNPQAEIEGSTMTKFEGRGSEVSFARALQSIFLKDPNIVMVSQIPDTQTADAIAKYTTDESANPHRVYAGVGAGDTLGALETWLALNSDKSMAIDALRMILAERLVRILCPTCKIPYQPDEGTLKKLNLPVSNLQSFKANNQPIVDKKGNRIICPDCLGMGYRGRTGMFEVLLVTDEMKKAIKSNAQQNQIKSIARKNNMILLVEHGIRKFASGITAINEVTRVLGPEKQPAAKSEA